MGLAIVQCGVTTRIAVRTTRKDLPRSAGVLLPSTQ